MLGGRFAVARQRGGPPMSKRKRRASQQSLAELAYNLKRLRKARGYTQAALARRTGLGQGYIGDIEREKINATLANLEALANGLNCSLYDLFMPIMEGQQ